MLDQDGTVKLAKLASKQAGFGPHNDKDEEKADEEADGEAPDPTTGGRNTSVLLTVVLRLGGAQVGSALQVLGYGVARLDEPGDAQMFLSLLQHQTAELGGHKMAFFLGYRTPLMGEARFARYQVW